MISPASGIHRPSYNGAPAIQTITKENKWPRTFSDSRFLVRSTCASALLAPLEDAFIKPVRTPSGVLKNVTCAARQRRAYQ